MKKIRCGELGANRDKRELEELGFVWNFIESEWSERIMPALETFHRQKGHCRMPTSVVVASDENWPTPAWDLRLGRVVHKIRGRGSYSAQVSRDNSIEELGFVWDAFEYDWSERIIPALEIFHGIRGHCRFHSAFVVPSDESWPTSSWGLKLGNVISSIRSDDTYSAQVSRDKTRLEELGFVWGISEYEWSERILPALATFHKVYGAIEFDSKIAFSKWYQRVEPILDTFEQLHGHRNVSRDFVVPSISPWEEKDWGVQLGKTRAERVSPREVAGHRTEYLVNLCR
ncbi:hypothetical protein ON010_g14355 [Phytophthora cinnamomi]|nr:hypothetical protein ON010_g14355 [Phytophthora cinnamomi]